MRNLLSMVIFLAVVGCAHPFAKVQPGMTTAELRGITGEMAPTDVVPYPSGAQTWFYGKDLCVLLINDRVVAKWSEDTAPKNTTSVVCNPANESPTGMPQPGEKK